MAKSKNPQSVYSHQKLETASLRVPFRQLVTETAKYQYRDLAELEKKDDAYKQLKTKISDVGGNDVAMLVKPVGPIERDGTACSIPEGTKLVIIDGHRRHSVIGDLISEGVKPFNPEMLVKVDVIISDDIKDEELVIRAASLNTTQKTWGEFGRIKAVTTLYSRA